MHLYFIDFSSEVTENSQRVCHYLPAPYLKALSDKALNSCRVKKTRHEINMLSVKDTIERYCKLNTRRYFHAALENCRV